MADSDYDRDVGQKTEYEVVASAVDKTQENGFPRMICCWNDAAAEGHERHKRQSQRSDKRGRVA